MSPHEILRGHDLGDALDKLLANAVPAPGWSGSAPSRVPPSRPSGDHPFRKEEPLG